MECTSAERTDTQLRIATVKLNALLSSNQRRNFRHLPQRRSRNAVTETQGKQVFGVALDRF
ncbi:hypothetical protein D3C73_1612830 [compost metagenome]